MRENGTVYWLLTDHLGSTAMVVNQAGDVIAERRYYAFGDSRYDSGTLPTRYRFTGQREESTIGLYFYNARWYDAALRRFIQADTVVPEPGNPQALNRYSYVYNNPLRYTDPSGHYILLEDEPEFAVRTTSSGEFRILRGGRWFRNLYELAWANYLLSGGATALPPMPTGAFGSTVIGSAANAARALGAQGSRGSAANLLADPLTVFGLAHIVGKATEDVLEAAAIPARKIAQQVSGTAQKIFLSFKSLPTQPGLEWHHLIEKRFADVIGVKPGDLPGDYVTPGEHRGPGSITSGLRRRLTYGERHAPEAIWEAHKEVYAEKGRFDWIEAIRPYFEALRVRR